MAKVVSLAFVLVLLFASGAASRAHATDVRPCPATPVTVDELLGLADGAGFAGFAGQLNPGGLACYEGSDVTVQGFVQEPEGLGGTSVVVIEPTWLTEWGLFLYASSRERDGAPVGPAYVVAYPPGSGDLNKRYDGRWVSVVAHFDDPAAQTCHAEGPADADPPTDEEAVAMCRQILVLSSIKPTRAPDTATLSFAPSEPLPTAALAFAAGALGAMAWILRPSRRRPESKRPGR
jgi:hypothetical protein